MQARDSRLPAADYCLCFVLSSPLIAKEHERLLPGFSRPAFQARGISWGGGGRIGRRIGAAAAGIIMYLLGNGQVRKSMRIFAVLSLLVTIVRPGVRA